MPQVRLLIALVLAAVVIGGWFYGTLFWRVAPLAISVVWALVEIAIERSRRRPMDPVEPDSASRS